MATWNKQASNIPPQNKTDKICHGRYSHGGNSHPSHHLDLRRFGVRRADHGAQLSVELRRPASEVIRIADIATIATGVLDDAMPYERLGPFANGAARNSRQFIKLVQRQRPMTVAVVVLQDDHCDVQIGEHVDEVTLARVARSPHAKQHQLQARGNASNLVVRVKSRTRTGHGVPPVGTSRMVSTPPSHHAALARTLVELNIIPCFRAEQKKFSRRSQPRNHDGITESGDAMPLSDAEEDYRIGKVTGSLANVLMTATHEAALIKAWLIKTGQEPPPPETYAMRAGAHMEVLILNERELQTGQKITRRGEIVDHPTDSDICVKLDGYRAADDAIIEVKFLAPWRNREEFI